MKKELITFSIANPILVAFGISDSCAQLKSEGTVAL